VTLEKGMP
jgi:hypothetical protein